MKMLKLASIVFVLSLFLVGQATQVFAKDIKLGYVNMSKAFGEYQKTKEAHSGLEKNLEAKKIERQKMVDEVSKLKNEMELLNEKAKKDKESVLREKLTKLQEFDEAVYNEIGQERDKLAMEIGKEIEGIVKTYGKQNGYTMILNENNLSMTYGDETLDVTQDIIDILNKSYKKK